MQPTFPFRVYPPCGCEAPPEIPAAEDGVFDAAGALTDGSRLLLAYNSGVIVELALVKPGGDYEQANRDLYRRVGAGVRTVPHAGPEEASSSG